MSSGDSAEGNDQAKAAANPKTAQHADGFVSVTVRKSTPSQKAGFSLVQRQESVRISKIAENGIFHNTEIEVGDIVLSVNGKRVPKSDGMQEVVKQISNAKTTVTVVVKKPNRRPRRSSKQMSPTSFLKKKKHPQRIKRGVPRNPDGSLKTDQNPRLDNLKKNEDDFKPQVVIKANKIVPTQGVGLRFKDIHNKIFVSGISLDSIFKDTDLRLGDRIVAVNDMSFMDFGEAAYARRVISKAAKEVTFVVEKGDGDFSLEHDVDPGHAKTWSDHSRYSEHRRSITLSPGKLAADSEESDSGDGSDNLTKIVRGMNGSAKKSSGSKKTRRSKSGHGKAKERLIKLKSKARSEHAKSVAGSTQMDESDDSSTEDFAEDEVRERMMQQLLPPKSLNPQPVSKLNHDALSRSVAFSFDDYQGDYIKVTVRKESKTDSGLSLEKTAGKFLLTKVPDLEKRIRPGMQVLAINGIASLNSVAKAEEIINQTKGVVELIIDFSIPNLHNFDCPCCSQPMTADGKHLKNAVGGSLRSMTGTVSISESVKTAVASNLGPPGTRIRRIPKLKYPYQIGEFDSDSDGSGEEEEKKVVKRNPIVQHQPNDKFMVRVAKNGRNQDAGIQAFEHKGVIYVGKVDADGLFNSTPIQKGDIILSVNGKKASIVKTAATAMDIIEEKDTVNLYVQRPDPEDKNYQEAVALFPT